MDTKTAHRDDEPFYEERRPRGSTRKALFWRVVLLVGSFALAQAVVSALSGRDASAPHECRVAPDDPEAIWSKIPPSSIDSLSWTPCYSGQECAMLMVPLDYSKPSGRQAGIAIYKVPSKLAPGDEKYKGPILLNPGGPGGSGVGLAIRLGTGLQKLVGEEFDIIGFDPRGVGRTTPQIVFFEDEAEGAAWRLRVEGDPLINSSADALTRQYARSQVQNAIANRTTAHASPYVSTALVARDMLSIVKAHGQDKLQYWGFSYGTILGATYAAMFPDNVGRLIIDGVVDADDYYAGSWSNNLIDTDTALRMILDACVAAGPTKCALYESTTDKVHARLTSIFDNLKKQPLPIYNSTSGREYGLVDYKLVRTALFMLLYSPNGGTNISADYPAQNFLNALAHVEKGDGLPFGRLTHLVPVEPPFSCSCPGEPGKPTVVPFLWLEASTAIACSDSDAAHADDTIEDLEEFFEELAKGTEFADQWAVTLACIGWRARPVERFAGPFVANTSFPLLLIGNTADPVTPLTHARKMSRGFDNSVVLHQDSAGHCSLSATSLCSAKIVREYFRDGKLPKNGTVCSVESTIFPTDAVAPRVHALSAEDFAVLEAWKEIAAAVEIPKLGRVL
ncbi:alpha/beta hydrolase [Phanerochaete sordida]|uniref:Alpha/beta hydrolase n=1 Tax=Phanerochaete sordida TaxID=48140 RepID=A0A9P3GJD5_9APHY|nr:alpha/beta hydrolase [Phanerochaete sordida]